ncbi:MAG: methyltransferase [Terriglobia bacterium]|nr:MAG: methyltransferase [Terriglobia bacterium]
MQPSTSIHPVLSDNIAWKVLARLDEAAAAFRSGPAERAMDVIMESLQEVREKMLPGEWAEFARAVREHHDLGRALYSDPLTRRALEKPRGYAGDAVMMDYVYGIHSCHEADDQASRLGREIHRYIQGCFAGQAVCHRRRHIAQLIDRVAADRPNAAMLAIAAGHLREAELSQALGAGRVARFVALDTDAASLREVAHHYAPLGVETVLGSVRHILGRKLSLGEFDLVYAAGLFDYLADNIAQALTARMFEMTRPGGFILIPNFAPQVRERGYMESFMDWHLLYRDESDMSRLVSGIDPDAIDHCDIYSDSTGSVVYLLLQKVLRRRA